MAYTKGPEVRALLMVRVDKHPVDAAQRLVPLVAERQWTPEWSIKRIDIVDVEESLKLDKPFAPKTAFSLCVAVRARNRDTLQAAFREIVMKLGTETEALILIGSFGADW